MPTCVRLDVSTRAMPKSATLSTPWLGDDQVRRLDVAMHDAAGVRELERVQQLVHQRDELREVEASRGG